MKLEIFSETILSFRNRTPYHPFTIVTVAGRKYEIDRPDAIVERDGMAVYAAPGGIPVIFDHEGVSEIIGDLATSEPSVNF
jgi:hypothetical protein